MRQRFAVTIVVCHLTDSQSSAPPGRSSKPGWAWLRRLVGIVKRLAWLVSLASHFAT